MIPLSDPDLVTRRRPFINILIIVLCALVFFYELTLGEAESNIFFYKFGFIPEELTRGIALTTVTIARRTYDVTSPIPNILTIFTSMFIHGGWLHILGNMLYLWVFGDNIEDRFGHLKYLLFYLAAGVFASATQILSGPASKVPNIGASGAIAGVLGAYFVLYPFSRIRTMVFYFLITFVRIPAVFLLGFWFFLQFVSGVGSIGTSAQSEGIAYWAHIGGFVAGVGVGLIYKFLSRQTRPPAPEAPVSP